LKWLKPELLRKLKSVQVIWNTIKVEKYADRNFRGLRGIFTV